MPIGTWLVQPEVILTPRWTWVQSANQLVQMATPKLVVAAMSPWAAVVLAALELLICSGNYPRTLTFTTRLLSGVNEKVKKPLRMFNYHIFLVA